MQLMSSKHANSQSSTVSADRDLSGSDEYIVPD